MPHIDSHVQDNRLSCMLNPPVIMDVTAEVIFELGDRFVGHPPIDSPVVNHHGRDWGLNVIMGVMVPPQQDNLSIELISIVFVSLQDSLSNLDWTGFVDNVFGLAEVEVPKMENRVLGFDSLIPPADELTIHMVERMERAVAIFSDLVMVKMRVSGEPQIHILSPMMAGRAETRTRTSRATT